MKKYHYVYRLDHIDTGEFYFGSRSSKYHPSVDTYMGSMKTWKPDKTKLKKTILKDDFKDRNDAMNYESKIISEDINHELNRNYNIPNRGYHTEGTINLRDENGNKFQVSINDPRIKTEELFHHAKGTISVCDSEGNCIKTTQNDPLYIDGHLSGYLKNKVIVKDKNNLRQVVRCNDPRYLSGELIPAMQNRKFFKDKHGKLFLLEIDDIKIKLHSLVAASTYSGRTHTTESKEKMRQTHKQNNHSQGSKNSQYGTCWIYNKNLKQNKKIKKDELSTWMNVGWISGRKLKNNK